MTSATAKAAIDRRKTNAAGGISYAGNPPYATDNFYIVSGDALIPVDVRQTARGFLATDRLVDRWGEGTTEQEALDELYAALLDYFADLEDHAGRLSVRLQHHMHILQNVLGAHGGI